MADGDHTNGKKHCQDDPHACISQAVRQWVLSSYLMSKQQAAGIALYQYLAPEGSANGYGNWSFQMPEWNARVSLSSSDCERCGIYFI